MLIVLSCSECILYVYIATTPRQGTKNVVDFGAHRFIKPDLLDDESNILLPRGISTSVLLLYQDSTDTKNGGSYPFIISITGNSVLYHNVQDNQYTPNPKRNNSRNHTSRILDVSVKHTLLIHRRRYLCIPAESKTGFTNYVYWRIL